MKFSLFIVFFIKSIYSLSAQVTPVELHGDWISYKIEMRDGSRLFDRNLKNQNGLIFSFASKVMEIDNQLGITHESTATEITFKNDRLKIKNSKTSGYKIEFIKNDTLILSEDFLDLTDDKMKRFYLINASSVIRNIENQNVGKDYVIASSYYCPILNENIERLLSAKINVRQNFNLRGTLRLDIVNKLVYVSISEPDGLLTKDLQEITKLFSNSFRSWDVSNFSQYKIVEIPLFIDSYFNDRVSMFKVYFCEERITKPNDDINFEEIAASTRYSNVGFEAYNKGDLDKALEFFGRAYKADPMNLDALYNKAAILFAQNKKVEACADWKILADLGQITAIELLSANCE